MRFLGLTDRRERRRMKKDIIVQAGPKIPRNELQNLSKHTNEIYEGEILEKQPPIKVGRKRNVAPGIAIMENFSARNVAKTRLTVS